MKTIRLLAALVLSLLLAPLTAAQSVYVFAGQQHTSPWPAGVGGSGSFGRGMPGHFTLATAEDAVLLRGTTPVLLVRPDQFLAPLPFSVSANDLDTLPGGAPDGLDAVVFVGASGVTLGWFDAAAGAVTTRLLSAGSSNAQLVRAGDLNADGVQDFVVLEADGLTLTTYLADGTGEYVASSSFMAAARCHNLVVVRWDGDAEAEFALLTDVGVEVLDDDGAPLISWSSVLPGGALCAFSQAGASADRLLWITAFAPPAQQYMMTLSSAGVDDLVNLGSLDAFAVVATDYDLDGFEDVLVSHKYSHELLWFENQRSASNPNGSSFSANYTDMIEFRVGPPASGAPENDAWPIVADFDGDGDDDIVFPVEATQDLTVLRGESVDETQLYVHASSGSYVIDPVTQTGVLQLSFDPAVAQPAAADALELEVWRRPDLTGPLDALSVEHLLVELPASWPLVVDVSLPENDALFTNSYYVQARLVQRDPQGQVIARLPTAVIGFSPLATNEALLAKGETVIDTVPILIPDQQGSGTKAQALSVVAGLPPGSAPKSTVTMF